MKNRETYAEKVKSMEEFFEMSPAMRDQHVDRGFKVKYPWKEVPKGKSFIISDDKFKLATIRSYVIRMGRKYGKRFKVVHHEKDKVYEVGCLQDGLPIIPEGRRVVKKAKAEDVKIVDGKFVAPLPEGWGLAIGDATLVAPFPEKSWVKE